MLNHASPKGRSSHIAPAMPAGLSTPGLPGAKHADLKGLRYGEEDKACS